MVVDLSVKCLDGKVFWLRDAGRGLDRRCILRVHLKRADIATEEIAMKISPSSFPIRCCHVAGILEAANKLVRQGTRASNRIS